MNSNTVFLDRDGILIEDKGYVFQVKDLHFLPGVKEGLAKLKALGCQLIVISNQAGVAREFFSEGDVETFHSAMNTQLTDKSKIDAFFYCPHHPTASKNDKDKACECRKPGTKLLQLASEKFAISQSIMVGDKKSDIDCAHNFGIKGIFVETRYGPCENADYICKNFTEVVEEIMNHFSLS